MLFLACLALGACKDKKTASGTEPEAEEAAASECESAADCDEGERCVRHRCAAPLRSNNPTAEGVKREVERHQKRHTDRVDRSLDLPE